MARSKSRTRTGSTNRRLRSAVRASGYANQLTYTRTGLGLSGTTQRRRTAYAPYTSFVSRTRVTPLASLPMPRSQRPYRGFTKVASVRPWTEPGAVPEKNAQADKSTLVCVRRAERREVLHASRKTGQAGQRRPKPSELRNIRCKRR